MIRHSGTGQRTVPRAKTRLLLMAAFGFAGGGLAAWMTGVRGGPGAAAAALSASEKSGSGDGDGNGGQGRKGFTAKKGTEAAWEALTAGGKKGLALYLARTDLIRRAASGDLPGLLKLAGEDPDLRNLLLRRWTDLDPAAAGKWVMTKGNGRDGAMVRVFSAWAAKDAAAALAGLRADAAPAAFISGSTEVLNHLLKENPEAGVRFGALAPPGRYLNGDGSLRGSTDWVAKDPAKAAALLSVLPPGEFRDSGISRTLNELAKTDFAAALALWEKFPDPGMRIRLNATRTDFYREWARRDPAALNAYLNGRADGFERQSIRSAIATAMGETDLPGALAWAETNLPYGVAGGAGGSLFEKFNRENPAAALAWLETLSAGVSLDSSVATWVKALPDGGKPADILAKAETLPEGPLRDSLTACAWGKWYDQDPGALLHDLASRPAADLPPGIWAQLGTQTGDLDQGLKNLASVPPEAAPEFLGALFEKTIRPSDLSKFSTALETLTVPEQRAAAMRGAMRLLVFFTPAEVSRWAASLPAEERRFAAGLMEKDIVNLTPNQKKELIEPLR